MPISCLCSITENGVDGATLLNMDVHVFGKCSLCVAGQRLCFVHV